MRRPPSGWVAAALACHLSAAGALPERCQASEPPRATRLEDYLRRLGYEPFTLKKHGGKDLLVQVELGGKQRTFALDTGCGMTTLDEGAAGGLRTLGQLGVTLDDSFLGRLSEPSVVLMDRLVIGRAQFFNQPARIGKLSMDYVRVPFEGILGADFFARNFSLVDCSSSRVYVRGAKPSSEVSDALSQTLRHRGFFEVPLVPGYEPLIQARANDQTVHLLVDTGSAFSILDNSQQKRLDLTIIKWDEPVAGNLVRQEVSGRIVGLGEIGAHKLRVTRLKTFQIGSRKWEGLRWGLTNLKAWSPTGPGAAPETVEGLLGLEMLRNNGALIDFGTRKLWLLRE